MQAARTMKYLLFSVQYFNNFMCYPNQQKNAKSELSPGIKHKIHYSCG